ncbi:MAG: imidazoleglycerol-phosphate dehydratase HisB [Candidatus Omnitrophota bacterium]|nr:MAG: imidazoleglycerol-phosphate dehydratase HisB [Candidatus Omnitrophota bacterium]
MAKARIAKVKRKTSETDIQITLNIDGVGKSKIDTGINFLNHMLELFAKHGLFDLEIKAKGDLEVDIHHTNEDIGICLGQAFNKALGKRMSIRRFGEKSVPMDEALVQVRAVVDVSGRPFFNNIKSEKAISEKDVQGGYNLEYARQFFQALVNNFPITIHISVLEAGSDMHHLLEAIFKAAACALDEATEIDPRKKGVPSTKGRI